jgi:hypothetical protein
MSTLDLAQARPAWRPAVASASAHTDLLQRKCACGGSTGSTGECAECRRKRLQGERPAILQAKLRVNEPGDPYEREADAVAEQVMRQPSDGVRRLPVTLQRCGCSPASVSQAEAPPVVFEALGSAGQPLDTNTRAFMEPRLGHDFGRVRVHLDPAADASARAVQAKAFTVGQHVVFEAGRYTPETNDGKRLLAHELTHVIQQGAAGSTPVLQRTLEVENPSTALPGAPHREHWEEIRDSMATLSSDFTVVSGGAIEPANAAVCNNPARTTEQCLCDMHAEPDAWKIKVDDSAWPHTEEANKRRR